MATKNPIGGGVAKPTPISTSPVKPGAGVPGGSHPRPTIQRPAFVSKLPFGAQANSGDNTYTEIIKQTLASWGLSELASLVDQLGKTGASADEITLKIQQSDAYKQRFAGNEMRLKNGLGVLDPATYIALEGQYRQILSQLPAGFYTDRASLANFIGGDVSPAELSDRVALANQAYVMAPQEFRAAWDKYYGTSGVGGAVAAILDTSVAEPLIQQQVNAAGIGGAALSQGLQLTRSATAVQAAQRGVTIDQARAAYQQIAQRLSTDRSVSGRFGNSAVGVFDQSAEEQSTLLGSADAQQRQQLLYSQELAQFGGHGGASSDGMSNNPGTNY